MKHKTHTHTHKRLLSRKGFLFILVCICYFSNLYAHDITISNVNAVKVNTKKAQLSFNMNWMDAWYYQAAGPENHDAVWIFAKYLGTDSKWHHVQFSGFKTHTEASILMPADKKGVFITKKMSDTFSNFESDVTFTNIKLNWNLSSTNLYPPQEPYDVKIFAVEMIYIPQGAFYAGIDYTAGEQDIFYDSDSLGTEGFESDSYTAIMNAFPKTLINTGDARAPGGFPQIDSSLQYQPAYSSFPNGYNGFYCMKYEINQQQYVDFLNCLIPSELAGNRYSNPALDYGHDCSRIKRYSIDFDDSLQQYVTENPSLPHEYLGWEDAIAYADWAALRPMTELEFEKICRGTADAFEPIGTTYDYAYGSDIPLDDEYDLAMQQDNYAGDFDSIINFSAYEANILYRQTWFKYDFCEDEEGTELLGYMQNGVFANMATLQGDSLTRHATGAGFYGVMELSGNLNERCIGINERWYSSTADADTSTEEYDWSGSAIPPCGVTGVSFRVLTVNGIYKYYKDCPSPFQGNNGDGELDTSGRANVTGWPKEQAGNAPGAMTRGGRWNQVKERCYTADRLSLTGSVARTHESTMRFVRTF